MLKLEFIKVSLVENEIKVLFKLLKNRTHKISHNEIPSYEEHKISVIPILIGIGI